MKISYAPHFEKSFKPLPEEIKKKFKKQIKFF